MTRTEKRMAAARLRLQVREDRRRRRAREREAAARRRFHRRTGTGRTLARLAYDLATAAILAASLACFVVFAALLTGAA